MARTIVYPRAVTDATSDLEFRGPPSTASAASAETTYDDYKDKIAKYVPAEVLAFFAPRAATISDRPALVFAAAGVGLLATPGYLWQTAQGLPAEKKPLPHFYFLASVSFMVWAVATTRLGSLIGLDQIAASFILGTTVFVLPLVDELFVQVQRRWEAKRPPLPLRNRRPLRTGE
jgi:hypothetical protein